MLTDVESSDMVDSLTQMRWQCEIGCVSEKDSFGEIGVCSDAMMIVTTGRLKQMWCCYLGNTSFHLSPEPQSID